MCTLLVPPRSARHRGVEHVRFDRGSRRIRDHRPQQLPQPALPQVPGRCRAHLDGESGERTLVRALNPRLCHDWCLDSRLRDNVKLMGIACCRSSKTARCSEIAYQNKAVLCDLLFDASAETHRRPAAERRRFPHLARSVAEMTEPQPEAPKSAVPAAIKAATTDAEFSGQTLSEGDRRARGAYCNAEEGVPMGIGRDFSEAIIREHLHRPLAGDIVLMGRQTVYLAPHELVEVLADHGRTPCISDFELDRETLFRRASHADRPLVSDRAFFAALGIPRIKALDHTAYEGAEIIHDLTKPLPYDLHGIADVVIDGSTLDNCFDPALTMRTYTQLLRPNGRLMAINGWSRHHDPYIMPSPLWYLDYCAINGFADCKVYIVTYLQGGAAVFTIDTSWLLDRNRKVRTFTAPGETAVILAAEKGVESTGHLAPVQQQYRPALDWSAYRRAIKRFASSGRPPLSRSRGPWHDFEVPAGHLYIDRDYRLRPLDSVLPGPLARRYFRSLPQLRTTRRIPLRRAASQAGRR